MNHTLETALTLHQQGISVVPVKADGTKRPAGNWKQYTTSRATPNELNTWFTDTNLGIGVVTGKISGHLELLEVEGRAANNVIELKELAQASGLADLWETITTGWFELSPSGGYHWLYQVAWTPEDGKFPGNTKLAQNTNRETIAETRSENGFVIIAPSAGTVHATGKPWTLLKGGPTTIPTITKEQRTQLHTLFATLNEHTPHHEEQPNLLDQALNNTPPTTSSNNGTKPGDDYENKTDWKDILEPHGWTLIFTRGQTRYWRRPGKTDPGFSATTGHATDRDRLYVFTTSTEFTHENPYTKFGAHALLNYGGDHSAAARALKNEGYGTEPKIPVEEKTRPRQLQLASNNPTPTTAPPTAGTTALKMDRPGQDIPQTQQVTLTDHGNAQLLIERHGKHFRYAPSRGSWLAWDKTRWAWQEDDGPIIEATWETIEAIKPDSDAERTHKHRSLSRRGLESAAALARRDSRIRVNADELDNQPHHLNTPTGPIDLRTGQISPPDPKNLHTKTTTAHHNPNATAPLWRAFLNSTFGDDPKMIDFFQRLAGYAATGEVTHHILPFLHGSGGNGKSVALDTLMAILGDYATSAPAGFLMAGRDQHETEVARLAGMRLVVASEVNQESRFDEAKVKLLTGGDKLTARFMRQDHFSFTPSHTLIIMGNHQPRVGAGGESFWRRLRLIPFTRKVPDEQRIDGLAQKLITEESEGILNWIIEGARKVLADGLQEPDSVMAATSTYAAEEDALARFISDKCVQGPTTYFRTETGLMRREYAQWCREQGEQELSPQQFGRELRTRIDIQQKKSNGRRYYLGITIQPDEDTLDGPDHWSNK